MKPFSNERRTRDGGDAMKTKIASFSGNNFVAERNGDELEIFMITNGPISGVNTVDRARPQTPADLNRRNRAAYNR